MPDVPPTTTGPGGVLGPAPPVAGMQDAPWQQGGHFRAGDAVMLGQGTTWYPVTVEADDYTDGRYLPGGAGQYRHRGGRCARCATDVTRQQVGAAVAERSYRSTFIPAARHLADTLRADGLVRMRSDGCGPYCSLAPHAPLPAWLHTTLAGTYFGQPERGWPNFARSGSPVDWPALIEEHPEWLVVDQNSLDAGAGAQWSGIVAAYRSLAVDGYRPYFDADLGVSEDGRISVEPMGLLVDDVPLDIVVEVDELLIAAGRRREDLRYLNEDTEHCWTLNR